MSLRVAMIGLRAPGAEGGVEHVVAELGPRLVARGCEVTAFCRPRYNSHGTELGGMDLVDVPTVYTKHLEAFVHTGLSMARALRGFDLVHVHATGPALFSVLPRLAGVPTVATVHALDWQREKWGPVARLALRAGAWAAGTFPDAVITVSQETTARYAAKGHKVRRIPNGASAIPFAPMDRAAVPGLQAGFILYLGRLVPEKAIETLLRAHRSSGTSRQLVITGSDGHSASYGRHLRGLAGPRVLFTGPRFGESKSALLHHAAAVASASRLEGLPVGLLEAMSCGRPLLASDILPHRELLADGAAGRLVPVDDVHAWADALRGIDDPAFTALGAHGRRRAAECFDWEAIADRTLGTYRWAVTRCRDRGGPLATHGPAGLS